jgi:hypothetical protein
LLNISNKVLNINMDYNKKTIINILFWRKIEKIN